MTMVVPRQYKIDRSGDSWWRFAAYRKHRLLGVEFWVSFRKTDYLSNAREAIEEDMKLPIFINEEAA